MTATGIGDLAQSHMLQRRNTSIRQDMLRLTQELATGQVADIRQVLDGNYGQLTDIARRSETLDGFQVAANEASLFADNIQGSLDRVAEVSTALSSQLLLSGTTIVGTTGADIAAEARLTLGAIVGTLNSNLGGRNLFSGTATDRAPLPDVDTILSELRTAISGATTPDDMLLAAQVWFDDPAGYASVVYQGSADDLQPFSLSDSEAVDLTVRADDQILRDAIRQVAVAALAADPTFALTEPAQAELYGKTAAQMLGSKDDIISLRARIGFAQERIDTVTARNAAELTSLEFARKALVAVDPFETATNLENVQFQLQSLYSVTVRMSQLSLVNFL